MNIEDGDLIEDLDIDNLDHAEKFLLATESRIGPIDSNGQGKIELICANGNRCRFPKNGINHGNVVWAYSRARERSLKNLQCRCNDYCRQFKY